LQLHLNNMLARRLFRVPVRAAPRSTGAKAYSELVLPGKPNKEWLAEREAVEHHAGETSELWRKLSLYVAVPATLLTTLWVRKVESEHAAHEEHIKEENGGELPPTPQFDYLNKRAKPFPWGMNTLFFNSHTQKNLEESE